MIIPQPDINYTRIQLIFYSINNQFLPQNLIPKFTKQQQQLHAKLNFKII